MSEIIIADPVQHVAQIRELFWEYLEWGNLRVEEEYGVRLDIRAMLEEDMSHLDKFIPPCGRLLLGYVDNRLAGSACLKELKGDTGEVKRMYVRPEYRKMGLGRTLLDRLVEEAGQIGYGQLRLDSAGFMSDAHRLYRAAGFRDIKAYAESEIPSEFQKYWVFMERDLAPVPLDPGEL